MWPHVKKDKSIKGGLYNQNRQEKGKEKQGLHTKA